MSIEQSICFSWPRGTKLERNPGELLTGSVLGTVEIVSYVWSEIDGCFRYQLRNPHRLRKTLRPKKQPQLKFFRLSKTLIRSLLPRRLFFP